MKPAPVVTPKDPSFTPSIENIVGSPAGYGPIGSMYGIYGNMDPINIPQMLAYIPYMDPMGEGLKKP